MNHPTRTSWRALSGGAVALLAVIALVAGCAKKQRQGGRFSMPPLPVEVADVAPTPLFERFTAVGTFEAVEQATVVAEIDGLVESLPFREGNAIERGGAIAQLDDDQLRAECDRAAALLDQARAMHDRVRTIVEQKAGAAQDLDDATAALHVAEANLAVAKSRLGKSRITAPFAGVTGARRVSVGTYVRAGDPITDLARLNELRVKFALPEAFLGRLRRGAPVAVSTAAFPDMALQGTIDVIEPLVDPGTRMVSVVARVDNAEERLRPGMSAEASVVLDERPAALTVPSEAILAQGDQTIVYVINPDSTVSATPVTLGLRLPDVVEVVSGLQAGARVVRAGHQKIYPGAKVLPLPSGGGSPGGHPGGAGPDAASRGDHR